MSNRIIHPEIAQKRDFLYFSAKIMEYALIFYRLACHWILFHGHLTILYTGAYSKITLDFRLFAKLFGAALSGFCESFSAE